MNTNRLTARFSQLRAAGRGGVLPYITAGDGGLATSLEVLRALDASGAAGVELGLPFSDPVADGPVLQHAAERALAAGTNFDGVLQLVRDFRAGSELPVVLLTYSNPLLRRGLDRALGELHDAGLDGVLMVDLPIEEGGPLVDAAARHELAPVFFAAPTTSDERIRAAAAASRGFLYAIGRFGVTGASAELAPSARAFLDHVRELAGDLPLAVGFGISTPEQVRAVLEHADIAIVGSALVAAIQTAIGAAADSASDPVQAAARGARDFLEPLTRETAT